jgi:hypothetical protein
MNQRTEELVAWATRLGLHLFVPDWPYDRWHVWPRTRPGEVTGLLNEDAVTAYLSGYFEALNMRGLLNEDGTVIS